MNPLLFTFLSFLAGVLIVAAAWSILSDLFLRDRSRVSKRVDDELRQRRTEQIKKSVLFRNLAENRDLSLEEDEQLPLRRRLEILVEQSGLTLTVRRLFLIMACSGLVVCLIGLVLFRSIAVGLIVGLLASSIPYFFVVIKRRARLEKLIKQLPDAFDMMARVIRAGHTISQALQSVGDEFDDPISDEFGRCYEQQNLGLPPEIALRDLARRTGLLEIKIFVSALLVQQQTGGNLAELLDRLAIVIRERFRIREKIKALTAEGRMQAIVLLALPPALLVIIMVLNRNYAQVLFEVPLILVVMLIAEVLGALWIRRIVNFDF